MNDEKPIHIREGVNGEPPKTLARSYNGTPPPKQVTQQVERPTSPPPPKKTK